MRVCLISPPTVTEFSERQVAESDALRLIAEHAPLGVLSLAAVLEARGITPQVIDLNQLYYDYLGSGASAGAGGDFASYATQHILEGEFDVFGFSTICSTYPLTLRLADGVKARRRGAAVILGGPQASVVDVATMKAYPFVDYVLRGEAEVTLPLLLDALWRGGDGLERVGGLTYRAGGEVLRNPNAPVIEDLDGLPMPAFHLYPQMERSSYAALEAGRGCPFACSFCSTNDFFRRRFRMKSPGVLVGQMVAVKRRYGINSFTLAHDMFTVDRKKVLAFCDAVEQSGETLIWSCSARTDCLDEELILRMSRAGCYGLFIGVDSGSERVQGDINKRLDIPEALARVRRACGRGINTTVSLIMGFPEETKDDLRATVRFLAEVARHRQADLQLHLLAPLAETPITTRYKDELIYDEIFSDMCFQGWEQSPEDRAMIRAHRDIFTNFYAVPTRWLDRYYLKEFKDFFRHAMLKHRLLMVALHRDSGDLLTVFDAWREWRPSDGSGAGEARDRAYYEGDRFTRDLLDFVRSHYIGLMSRRPAQMMTMAAVEAALYSLREDRGRARRPSRGAADEPRTLGVHSVPVVASGARLVCVPADYKHLVRCLRRGQSLERVAEGNYTLVLLKAGGDIRIVQLNQLTGDLLRACDGTRNMLEVASAFSPDREVAGVPSVKAGLYGLAALARQGLIEGGALSS
ncbi:MAG TPA: radical SAM protein [Pyrinomonadaceae bacterium]|jgi:radical SAM superfamily enzyme YgiQ (UPF0313 family)|nr:radical SAM protein [Pyrinomonadaceae bacterium]